MTLRQRLALHYGAVVLVALSLITGLTYHEVATEHRLRGLLGPIDESEIQHRKIFDVVVFSTVPVILLAGWWFTRRSLLPISNLAKAVERTQVDDLPLPRTGNGDEVDKLTEAFNVATQRLREFTMHASHELKTPLTVMRAELELEGRHDLIDEVDRLTRIVDGLTFLSKADAGQMKLERAPVQLAELVRESFEDAQILAESIQVTLTECAELTVLGDRHRLRQLLLNLVDNAVKYNQPQGAITMALRQVNGSAQIEITNTGPGIPDGLRVFDRFVRGNTGNEGCGLGLTIAQWIAKTHGGSIQISSKPGKTTTALVRLPLAR